GREPYHRDVGCGEPAAGQVAGRGQDRDAATRREQVERARRGDSREERGQEPPMAGEDETRPAHGQGSFMPSRAVAHGQVRSAGSAAAISLVRARSRPAWARKNARTSCWETPCPASMPASRSVTRLIEV